MTGIYVVEMLDVLADAGCAVAENDTTRGWQTRARSSGGFPATPLGIQWHHTASSTSPANDLSFMINGSQDSPVGNLLLDRTGTFWPVAAGAANTAGKGGPLTLSRGTIPVDQANTRSFAFEVANNGVGEPWPTAQIDAYFAGSNALNAHFGNQPGDVFTHGLGTGNGWTNRKIDPAVADAVQGPWRPRPVGSSRTWVLDDIRAEATRRATTTPTPPQEDDMQIVEVTVEGANASFLGQRLEQNTPRGPMQLILWVEWVDGRDPAQLARLQSYRQLGIPTHRMTTIADFAGVGLLGPVPEGDDRYAWKRADFGNVIT